MSQLEWKKYLGDRLIQDRGGIYVIKPEDDSRSIVPLTCPVCDYVMRNHDDEKSFRSFSCCECCETNWARPNQEKWKSGWRPTKEEIIKKLGRKKINVSLEF